ncbi:BTAD domain-containing putative transcriptional regulator [Kribbella sp. NPDC026611]|uniref:AfsR/SARP family transcriptional regulator n=1 Tax=Kribbella sp. NPDC026611 TaxID=3154911 RepID=UPI003401AA65
MIELRLLGPVVLMADGEAVDLGRPQQRLVLAVLAAEAGRVVAVETLIDRVWDEAPSGARRALHVAITRLRRILEQVSTADVPVRLVRRGGGYVLEIPPDRVDVLRYRALLGELPGRDHERLESLRQAMALWCGEPLTGVSGSWALRTRSSWWAQHLDVVAAWARAELAAGDPSAAIGVLAQLADEHPLTESLTEVLMLLLHATGRSADALAAYERLRKRLANELGVDPGAPVRAAYQQILSGVPRISVGKTGPVPRQLPAAVAQFVGRTAELEALNGLLADGAVPVTVIGGTAGVGKTALAVHWAHQVAGAFPDGQLYVNLRGFDAAGSVIDPADVIRRFLDALHLSPERVPVDLEAQATLYRSELAGRRMLIVLDNARDAAQVRPLLPGTPTCLVIVTSRNQLRGLVAAQGAHPVVLDLLTEFEARELLSLRLGPSRVSAEPEAIADIVTRCARLPLALALTAARAALEPDVSLRAMAEGLHDSLRRWETLTDDEPSVDVRTVFSWSYEALDTAAARVFRLLGTHPGPDISAPAAASLAGHDIATVRSLIDVLVRVGLLAEHTHGRYAMHDLLRSYAAELTPKTSPERDTAVRRMLDHYLHSANSADRLLAPLRPPLTLDEAWSGVTPERQDSPQQALDWLAAERPILVACIELAAASGYDAHAWQLARTLYTFFNRQGHWHDQAASTRIALAAVQRVGDLHAQAQILRSLSSACIMLRHFDEAEQHLNAAVELGVRSGDLLDRARTHDSFGFFWDQRGDPAEALKHADQALQLYRAAGDEPGQADALNAVGWCHSLLGRHEQAVEFCRQAFALHESLGNLSEQANTLHSIGHAHHQLGQYEEAMASYHRALGILEDVGNRYYQSIILTSIGDTRRAAGEVQSARRAWQQALTILEELQHPDAEKLRSTLATSR